MLDIETNRLRRPARSQWLVLVVPLLLLLALPGIGLAADTSGYLDLYAEILEQHTEATSDAVGVRVHYEALHADPRWSSLVAKVSQIDPDDVEGREQQLAFWINVYNIFTIDLIQRNLPVRSIRDLGGFFSPVWEKSVGTLAGRAVTLDEIEHAILRPMGEPRIHAAIVCASVSCPPLWREPFRAEALEAQLDGAMRAWLSSPTKGAALDRRGRTLTLSRIFRWFGDDFESRGGVVAFVRPYLSEADASWLGQPAHDVTLRYFRYDWSLND